MRGGSESAQALALLLTRTFITSVSLTRVPQKMAEQDEIAKLWKVSRTIHELVRDRVSQVPRISRVCVQIFGNRAFKYLRMKFIWISPHSGRIMRAAQGP